MISIKEVRSKAVSVGLHYMMDAYEFKKEFFEVLKELKTYIRVATPFSLLSILNNEKEQVKKEIIKVFEPNTHIFKRKLIFPENRDIYMDLLNNVPTGYGMLEPVDGSGYSIEDINTYVGDVTLIFYNDVYVNSVGVYDEESKVYVFDKPGVSLINEFNNSYVVL